MTQKIENQLPISSIETHKEETPPLSPLSQIEQEFKADIISSGVDSQIISPITISQSPAGVEGDYGLHCGQLSKIYHKKPQEIALDIVGNLVPKPDGLIKKYLAEGPYINAVIDYEKFSSIVLNRVLEQKSDYGKENIGHERKIIIDLSSPNIAKRMSIGHLRSTIIGDSLARIFKHLDYDVIKDNHLGDWGTQFGHLLRAIELWGDPEVIQANPIEELQKLYVRINDAGDPKSTLYTNLTQEEAIAQAEKIKNEGRNWFKKLEDGDQEARDMWQQIVNWSMMEFQAMYNILGVTFDWTRGESFYESQLKDTIQKVRESGIATESDGALVVNMEESKLGTSIIQKSDGATLYLTREIATGIHRAETEKADGMIYVVGEDQKLYFQQFFEILKRMGLKVADHSKHVYFGMIRLPEGKMSTRKGRTVLLQDVVAEAIKRTTEIVEKSGHVTEEKERQDLIRQIAIGALKWNDLMADPRRSIVFDWDNMLSMDGNSAPYVQYSYVRAHSILEKANIMEIQNVGIIPESDIEKTIIRLVADFPVAIKDAAETYNPSKIAAHIFNLAKSFNIFYHDLVILKENDEHKRNSRLALTAITAQTIKIGLDLLGIESPEKM